MKNRLSLNLILSIIIIISVTSIMVVSAMFNYVDTKKELSNKIINSSKTSIEQLKGSLEPYIKSYAIADYEKLIVNEMKHDDILAIVVEDFNMGKILGKKRFVVGKIKNKNWEVIDLSDTSENIKLLNNSYNQVKGDIVSDGNKLAAITIYSTDKFMKLELAALIERKIIVSSVISIVLILLLILSINYFVLKPVSNIVNFMQNTDKDGIPISKINVFGSKEIMILVKSMDKMIDTIKESRKKIRYQKEEFQTIFDNSKDGIAIMDLDSNFLNFNQAYLDMTGFTKDELLTKSCVGLSAPQDISRAKKTIETVLKTGHIENFEKSCIVKNDKQISINMSMTLLPDRKRLLATTKDVTQIKLIESQAKLASMGEMIGNIAHQWRQPLSIISTSASGIKIKKEYGVLEENEIEESLDTIINQTDYLSQTIDDFRNFIKDEDHARKEIDIVLVVNKALNLVDSSLKNHYIKVVSKVEDDMKIEGYENELVQAIINIINNAKDAIDEYIDQKDDKYIFIETKKVNNSLELTILDNAGGIDKKVIDRIFEPYFTTKHKSLGTGIGLSLARSIITDHHHANISVTNEEHEYDGKKFIGACFKIVFNEEV